VIKAVFFDWFNTLARFDPPREELYRRAFLIYGHELSYKTIYMGLQVGDRFFFSESAKTLVRGKSFQERARHFIRYVQAICEEAKISLPPDIQLQIIQNVLHEYSNTYVLFEDVIPLFNQLKSKGIILGIITNADKNIAIQIDKLNIRFYTNILITSDQIGVEKPAAPIFLAALEQAKVNASESIYVGDQYKSDILGAIGVGMKPVLIDRYDVCPEVRDCRRIQSLSEVISCL
jgi:HAD superfamily hydrolase (TIGR01549 family)